MDQYNGEVIAFETSKRPEFALVGAMMKKALKKLKTGETPILHLDKAGNSECPLISAPCENRTWCRACRTKETVSAMPQWKASSPSKSEFFHLNKFTGVDELQSSLKKYIRYYNHDRIKMKLKGLSAAQYSTQPLAAQ